jgi:transcriptional regulator with XRE-family HTH domain
MIGKDDLYRFIGDKIKAKRLANSLNQEDLANLVGLTRSSIAQIEAGRQAPSVYLLYQLCGILKTTIISLLPKDEFDPISSERVMERDEIVGILDKVKGEQKYELP